MKIWHGTNNTPRVPSEVRADRAVEIWIGSYPIEQDQQITIEWKASGVNGSNGEGEVKALWQYNNFPKGSSYWLAEVGPFAKGDRVDYTIKGRSGGGNVSLVSFTFNVE